MKEDQPGARLGLINAQHFPEGGTGVPTLQASETVIVTVTATVTVTVTVIVTVIGDREYGS